MMPDSMFESQNFQENIDRIRLEQGFDFAALAFYESASTFSTIKWQYVSGNKNDRYKLIILRKGRGLAGNVMKTGNRMVIANVDMALTPDEKVKFPILLSENLTAVIAIPLWYQQQVYGVMLFGQRNHKPLPINVYDIDIYEQLGIFNEEI